MPAIILKRAVREGGVLQKKGTALEVDQDRADFLISKGSAELVESEEAKVDESPVDVPEAPVDVDEKTVGATALPAVEPVEVETATEEPAAEPVDAPDVAATGSPLKRPAKGRDLATWQAYTKSQGRDPKGKTREELIAMWT